MPAADHLDLSLSIIRQHPVHNFAFISLARPLCDFLTGTEYGDMHLTLEPSLAAWYKAFIHAVPGVEFSQSHKEGGCLSLQFVKTDQRLAAQSAEHISRALHSSRHRRSHKVVSNTGEREGETETTRGKAEETVSTDTPSPTVPQTETQGERETGVVRPKGTPRGRGSVRGRGGMARVSASEGDSSPAPASLSGRGERERETDKRPAPIKWAVTGAPTSPSPSPSLSRSVSGSNSPSVSYRGSVDTTVVKNMFRSILGGGQR
ncbi:hypothetical protein KIPB_004200 [Kipferlia bialata]|uniref:Uncharacterized protein n=1 Tax=Kipferlia bialata TaxID=797122 RepID=A0A9K3GHY5_9EUKA|nr:hypothetical protein KIPB_004200 [Kipferlia bialata]|eukprot:g4200.t1